MIQSWTGVTLLALASGLGGGILIVDQGLRSQSALGDGVPPWREAVEDSLSLEPELHQRLSDWQIDDQALVTTCHFTDFVETIAFVNQLVEPAERLGHHPDLMISYNQLSIRLTSHDAGGITEQDIALAQEISALALEHCGRRPEEH